MGLGRASPSYLGAMAAHYLDVLYLLYIEAFLLNLVLVKRSVAEGEEEDMKPRIITLAPGADEQRIRGRTR
jgi:hypothetical protein